MCPFLQNLKIFQIKKFYNIFFKKIYNVFKKKINELFELFKIFSIFGCEFFIYLLNLLWYAGVVSQVMLSFASLCFNYIFLTVGSMATLCLYCFANASDSPVEMIFFTNATKKSVIESRYIRCSCYKLLNKISWIF